MDAHYTYAVILAASLAGPLLLSFDNKVRFYKKWKYLFPAMLLPALFYIIWDLFFTYKGVWSFNDDYITGLKLFGLLPFEEVLFFFVVPYCCVFIYECIRCYFPKLTNKHVADLILLSLALFVMVPGVIFYSKWYTSWTFLLLFLAIFLLYLFKKRLTAFDATSFLVSYAIILIPFLIVNGFLTAIPVVIYNDAENLGLRITSIPLEDTFYGMLLILLNVVGYEQLYQRDKKNKR